MSSLPSEALPTPSAALPGFRRVFTVVMLPMFLASLDQTLLAAATPAIAADFGGLADTTWVSLAYLLGAMVTIPLYGRLGDQLGRRPVLACALALFCAGSALGLAAPGMGWLVAARALQGLGAGGLMVLSQALIGELVPARERARYQGYFAAVFTLAGVSGPVIGGLVVQHAHWRWLFAGVLPIAALGLWRVLGLPPGARHPAPQGSGIDAWGIGGFALASTSLLLWLTFGGHRFAWVSGVSAALFGGSLLVWMVLVLQQRQRGEPLLPLDLLALRGMPALGLSVIVTAASMFCLIFFLPVYLQVGQGQSAASAGLALLPLTLGLASGGALAGRWMAHRGIAGTLPRWGLAWAGVMTGLLAWTEPRGLALGLLTVSIGLGLGLVMPTMQLVVQILGGQRHLGAAAALVSLARSFGAALGTALFAAAVFGATGHSGSVATTASGGIGLDPQLASAMHRAFAGLGLVLLLGAAIAARVPQVRLVDQG